MDEKSRSLAILVDGDNISHNVIKDIIDEASTHGNPKIRRVYGDWTKSNLTEWKEAANRNAILQIQQSNYTSGKNSTDGALIIDAMRMLYEGKVDGFCIVSSDSDYTRLAIELREQGKFVLGIGNTGTPQSLVNACNRFTYIETITANGGVQPVGRLPSVKTVSAQGSKHSHEWVGMVTKAIKELSGDDDTWVLLANVGNRLRAINPAFDPREYGYVNLHSLIESHPDKFLLEGHEIAGELSGHKVRLKTSEA
ncbi:MAG: NYN domain-containing protein [Thaumarchaeota archaeon]|nr:NYN domain-containing protein [Nitrososphaerota archaeon]